MFFQSDFDTIPGNITATNVYFHAFSMLRDYGYSRDSVEQYRAKVDPVLHLHDLAMTKLLIKQENSLLLLIAWTDRMRSCLKKVKILDENIVIKGTCGWNWYEVIQAMAFLEAFIKGAQCTLSENRVELSAGK